MPRYLTDLCTARVIVTTLAGLLLSAHGWAATDGDQGATSTGTLQISLVVEPSVRISALKDLALAVAGADAGRADSAACIHAHPGGRYQLSLAGSGQEHAFELRSGANQLSYQVRYDDGHRTRLAEPGIPLTGLQGADPISPDCGTTGHNGRVFVDVSSLPQHHPEPGLYTGTLTLMIAPD